MQFPSGLPLPDQVIVQYKNAVSNLSNKAFQKSKFKAVAMDKQPSRWNVQPSDILQGRKDYLNLRSEYRNKSFSYSRSEHTRRY